MREWRPALSLLFQIARLVFLSLIEEIPNADGNAKDGEEQGTEWFDAMLVVGLPNGVAADANSGEHKIPPLPFPAFGLVSALLAYGCEVFSQR